MNETEAMETCRVNRLAMIPANSDGYLWSVGDDGSVRTPPWSICGHGNTIAEAYADYRTREAGHEEAMKTIERGIGKPLA